MADGIIDISGMEAEISKLIDDLNKTQGAVDSETAKALSESGQIIVREQRRILSKRYPQLAGKIKLTKTATGKIYKVTAGYDTPTLREHPELLVIEFGRPGKSARRSKKTDKLGRKKGSFPQLTHIRAGYFVAKEAAVKHLQTRLLEIARSNFRG